MAVLKGDNGQLLYWFFKVIYKIALRPGITVARYMTGGLFLDVLAVIMLSIILVPFFHFPYGDGLAICHI